MNISRILQYFHPVQCVLTDRHYASDTVGTIQMQCGGAAYDKRSGELPYAAMPHAGHAISQEDLLAGVPSCPSCHRQACLCGSMYGVPTKGRKSPAARTRDNFQASLGVRCVKDP